MGTDAANRRRAGRAHRDARAANAASADTTRVTGGHHVADDAETEGVVGAPNKQGLDVGGGDGGEQALGEDGDLVATSEPTIDDKHSTKHGHAADDRLNLDARSRSGILDAAARRAPGSDRADGADHRPSGGRRHRRGPPRRGRRRAIKLHRARPPRSSRAGRRAVLHANDEGLDVVLLDQLQAARPAVTDGCRLVAADVRIEAGVADVDEVLARAAVDDGSGTVRPRTRSRTSRWGGGRGGPGPRRRLRPRRPEGQDCWRVARRRMVRDP